MNLLFDQYSLHDLREKNQLKELYTVSVYYQRNVPLSEWLVFFLTVSVPVLKLNNILCLSFLNETMRKTSTYILIWLLGELNEIIQVERVLLIVVAT